MNNNRVNSAKKFFDILNDSGLIKRLIDESPTGIINSGEFNKELLRLFKNRQVSQTAVDASKWVYMLIDQMETLTSNGTLDVWKDMQSIFEYYMYEIVYEKWLFEEMNKARDNRLKTLKVEIASAKILGDEYEVRRLQEKYNIMEERNAFLKAKGYTYKE